MQFDRAHLLQLTSGPSPVYGDLDLARTAGKGELGTENSVLVCDSQLDVLNVRSQKSKGVRGAVEMQDCGPSQFQNTKTSGVRSNALKTNQIELHRSLLFRWFALPIPGTIAWGF